MKINRARTFRERDGDLKYHHSENWLVLFIKLTVTKTIFFIFWSIQRRMAIKILRYVQVMPLTEDVRDSVWLATQYGYGNHWHHNLVLSLLMTRRTRRTERNLSLHFVAHELWLYLCSCKPFICVWNTYNNKRILIWVFLAIFLKDSKLLPKKLHHVTKNAQIIIFLVQYLASNPLNIYLWLYYTVFLIWDTFEAGFAYFIIINTSKVLVSANISIHFLQVVVRRAQIRFAFFEMNSENFRVKSTSPRKTWCTCHPLQTGPNKFRTCR